MALQANILKVLALFYMVSVKNQERKTHWKSGELVHVWVCMNHVAAIGCAKKIVPISYQKISDLQ